MLGKFMFRPKAARAAPPSAAPSTASQPVQQHPAPIAPPAPALTAAQMEAAEEDRLARSVLAARGGQYLAGRKTKADVEADAAAARVLALYRTTKEPA